MLLNTINDKLDEILRIHRSLPTWIPISKQYAKECGYKSIQGLRVWCFKHLPPDKFDKRGNSWCIHISVLHFVKRKVV